MDMSARFLGLCSSLGVPASVAASTTHFLSEAYSEQQRHYHTLAHVEAMLVGLDQVLKEAELGDGRDGIDARAIQMAIWFHDCVYDPVRGAPWNEEESGKRWEEFVEQAGGSLEPFHEPVAVLIASTISHLPPSPLPLSLSLPPVQLFLNLDITILASPPILYNSYAAAIRAEYSHVPIEDYRQGRVQVLEKFLARDVLFLGGEELGGGAVKEERARSNLRMEVEALRCGNMPK